MSSLPSFSMQELIEAGVHYGHKTQRWDPRMAPYLFGIRHDIHIIDLQQTMPLLQRALTAVRDIVSRNGRVLFVGTKRQAQQVVADEAKRCGQYYVNHRWLGGMLTNWKTVSQSLRHLRKLDEQLAQTNLRLKKKEILQLQRKKEKLERALGGIKEMAGLPNIIVVIDTNKEALAIDEAKRLGIPVIAILDSNSNPDGIAYPIPGNDDALRAIKLYCRLFSNAVLAGIQEEISKSGVDIGAAEDLSAVEAADAADAAAEAGATKSAKNASKAKSAAKTKKAVKTEAKADTAAEAAAETEAETEAEGSIAPDNDPETDEADTAEGKEETAKKKAS